MAEPTDAHLNQAMIFGAENFPQWILDAVECVRLVKDQVLGTDIASRDPLFNQCILNEYWPGEGIKSHVDLYRFADGIVSLTLCGNAMMVFSRVDDDSASVEVPLGPGDLLAMVGDARWKWRHGIPGRESDLVDGICISRGRRVSLTLRRLA